MLVKIIISNKTLNNLNITRLIVITTKNIYRTSYIELIKD